MAILGNVCDAAVTAGDRTRLDLIHSEHFRLVIPHITPD